MALRHWPRYPRLIVPVGSMGIAAIALASLIERLSGREWVSLLWRRRQLEAEGFTCVVP